jgi:molybdopterin-guanine dinucleotide biosynthesis protein A
MGVDKATVVITGEPLWQRQLRILHDLQPEIVRISARATPDWCPNEIEVVPDTPPSQGPLSGVAAGLQRMNTSHLLVLAIDLPQMTAKHLRELWNLARPGIGVVPRHDNYFEPLCAIYPAEALATAEAALNARDASLQHFAQTLLHQRRATAYELKLEERPLYLNMNSPSDLPLNERSGNTPT